MSKKTLPSIDSIMCPDSTSLNPLPIDQLLIWRRPVPLLTQRSRNFSCLPLKLVQSQKVYMKLETSSGSENSGHTELGHDSFLVNLHFAPSPSAWRPSFRLPERLPTWPPICRREGLTRARATSHVVGGLADEKSKLFYWFTTKFQNRLPRKGKSRNSGSEFSKPSP